MTDLFGPVCPCCGQDVPETTTAPFDQFWGKWPDKRAKATAEKAWHKLAPAEQKVALDRTTAWCKDWRKRNPEVSHIMASTFLNQRRFLDMEEQAPVATQNDIMQNQAEWIKAGKHFLCTSIKPSSVQAMIESGLVSVDECRRVGVM